MIQNMKLVFNQKKYFLLKNLIKESRQVLREIKKGHDKGLWSNSDSWVASHREQARNEDSTSPALKGTALRAWGVLEKWSLWNDLHFKNCWV